MYSNPIEVLKNDKSKCQLETVSDKKQYSYNENCFDPYNNTPPNNFLDTLQKRIEMRFSQSVLTNDISLCKKK